MCDDFQVESIVRISVTNSPFLYGVFFFLVFVSAFGFLFSLLHSCFNNRFGLLTGLNWYLSFSLVGMFLCFWVLCVHVCWSD